MTDRAHEPVPSATGWPAKGAERLRGLGEGRVAVDVMSLHAPRTDRPVIDRDALAAVQPSAILIETACGGRVNEGDLVETRRDGRIAVAALDLFADAVTVPSKPPFAADNGAVSPHVAGPSAACGRRTAIQRVRTVLDGSLGRADPSLLVNGHRLHG